MRSDYARSKRDFDELAGMLARIFNPRYDDLHRAVQTILQHERTPPGYRRIIRRRGRIVAHVAIHEMPVRIGCATMRMGGIGGVACEPQYRRAGLAAQCFNDAMTVLQQEKIPLSFLAGIDRYYLRFGYIGCLPGWGLKLRSQHLKDLKQPFAVAPAVAADVECMTELYNAAAAATPGSVVRDRRRFSVALKYRELLTSKQNPSVYVFRQKQGQRRIRAYLVWKENSLWEAAMQPGDDAACAAVLAWLRQKREELVEKEVELNGLSPAHPLYIYAQRLNHTASKSFSWSGNWMGRIIDVAGFLQGLWPELEARRLAAGLDAQCRLSLKVDGANHYVALGRAGGAAINAQIACSAQSLLQMALGSLPLTALPDVRITGNAALARALFPEAAPGIYRLDAF